MQPFSNNNKLTVINFFSGPGAGKSTTAAAVFSEMKKHNLKQLNKVEFVTEFPKELVWEQRHDMFTEQDFIFAHQHRSIRRLVNHDINYAVVDSSILLGILYQPDWYPKTFAPFVAEVFNSYDNINILLERNPDYQYVEAGRNQTYQEALDKDREVLDLLHKYSERAPHHVVNDADVVQNIINIILNSHSAQRRTHEERAKK